MMQRFPPGDGRGRPVLLRGLQLVAGLLVFGVAIALMIRSGLGLGPWDVFHVGLARLTGASVGAVIIGVGAVIVLLTTAMRSRPGTATVANMVLIGIFVDAILPRVPEAQGPILPWAFLGAGIALSGLATGMYIGAGFGNGPRDGLMLVLSGRSGWSVRRVRTLMEAAVLALGWAMGGQVGFGTLAFTLSIGPAAQWGLQLFGADAGAAGATGDGPAGGRARHARRPLRKAA